MEELAAMFAEAGCSNVRTYIQSGNVVWRALAIARRIPERVASLDPARSPPDRFALGRTKLTNAYLDETLATVSTVRNWGTVLALLAMTGHA